MRNYSDSDRLSTGLSNICGAQVSAIHDLHVWAMSTSDNVLTAHLLMLGGHPGDAFFKEIATTLHDRFEIRHSTIQIDLTRLDHGCAMVK